MAAAVKSYRITEFGGPEVMKLVDGDLDAPKEGELSILHEAIGVNFIDIYHRTGQFAAPLPLPSGLGVEGVGRVEAIGPGVDGFAVGDRVGYVGGPPGAYATLRLLPAARAVKLPDDVSSETAAALIFKGVTVEYLIRRCAPVRKGDVVLLHAAAGGVGLIACQWLKHLGAEVIGAVGSEEKAEIALAHGCDHAIISTREDVPGRVRELTGGEGVSVVYDSVGASTFAGSLDSLRPRGALVSFGASSGPVPPLDIAQLGGKGSLFVTRPSIAHYTADRAEFDAAAAALFDVLRSGAVRASKVTAYPLAEAAHCHADIEGRVTSGSLILVP